MTAFDEVKSCDCRQGYAGHQCEGYVFTNVFVILHKPDMPLRPLRGIIYDNLNDRIIGDRSDYGGGCPKYRSSKLCS